MANRPACKDFEQDLVLYYYRECPEDHRKAIAAHLESCADCTALLADLRKILPATVKADGPPETFWRDYTSELRQKIVRMEDRSPWWRSFLPAVFSSPLPAVAMAAVLVLAITLTFTVVKWRPEQVPSEETDLVEIVATGQSLEFFNTMDLLDSLEVLEAMDGPEDGSA